MKRILVPTDFSKNANKALNYALDLARRADAIVMLQHVFKSEDQAHLNGESFIMANDRVRTQLEFLKEELHRESENTNLKIEVFATLGNVVSTVNQLVNQYKVDLVVMGTKGASGFREVYIGSNAAHVIHSVSCPVLAIPENARSRTIRSILFATDLQELNNDNSLDALKEIAELFDVKINILNIRINDSQLTMEESLEYAREDTLLGNNVPHSHQLIQGFDVIEGINDYLNKHKNDIDMIAMVAHSYTLWERIFHSSKTDQMAFHTNIPLLALHD